MQYHVGQKVAVIVLVWNAPARFVCRDPLQPCLVRIIQKLSVILVRRAGKLAALAEIELRPEIETGRILPTKALEVLLLCYQNMSDDLKRSIGRRVLQCGDRP